MNLASLRSRVTVWYVGLLAAALIVFAASLYLALERYLHESMETALSGDATNIAEKFVAPVESKGTTWLNDELSESYPPDGSGRFIRISRVENGSNYQVLYEAPEMRGVIQTPPVNDSRGRTAELTSKTEGKVVLYSLPYRSASGTRYLVEAGASIRPTEQLLRSFFLILLVFAPLILIGAGIGGYLLMSQPLRPVVTLTNEAERIGVAEMGERLPVIATGDELERLSLSLNRMISRLEDALAHNRRFSADVSHELRTPLTILRGELEHVIQLPELRLDVVESVGSALEEIERLAKIVESLLAISHLDSGQAGIEFSPCDLHAMTATTTDQMRLLAEEKHITVRCNPSVPVYAFGDESRIKQVLVNLLDNAIKYTKQDGHIETLVTSHDGCAVLTVSDDGVGIPADSLPYVFDRFYRAERARPRGTAGAGLGLSIVQAICRAHGGTVSIHSVESQGTTVEVRLPLVKSPPPPSLSQEQQPVAS